MIPVCKPFWDEAEEQAMIRVARSGRLIQGPEVERFESVVAEFVGVRHAIACSSGTTALHIALMAAGVKAGDEVLVPAFTFVATANAVLMCGAIPVLADIDIETFCMASSDTSVVMQLPVSAFGHGAWHARSALPVIHDAACALGTCKYDQMLIAETYSFHATKVLCCGEGGMVVTNDENVAKACRLLRDQKHGTSMAYNYRMTEIQGAIGCEQMRKLPQILKERKEIAAIYDAEFAHIQARIPPSGGNYQSYVLLLHDGLRRDVVIDWLKARGVEALPGTQFLGDMPHLRQYTHGDLTNARIAGERAMRIPIWPGMDDEQIETVVKAVREVLA